MDPYPILQSELPVSLKVSIPTGFELFEKSDLWSLVSRWRAWSWSVVELLALDLALWSLLAFGHKMDSTFTATQS